jgi:integrase
LSRDSRTYALPWSAFPASLEAEIDAYLARLAGKDILAELPFRPLKPASLATRARQLQEYVSALVHRGRDPASLRSLAEVVAVEVVKDGLRFFLDRAGGKPTGQAHAIASVVKALAQHWVEVAPAHLEQLRTICRRLDPGHSGLAAKNRDRLRQFDDPANVQALVTLPQRLFAEVVRSGKPSRAAALRVQAAVAIELLLMVPLRITNLAQLKLGEHLIRSRKGVMHLAIPGHAVKNGVAIEALLQGPTVRLLEAYVETYLPLLRREPSPCEPSPWLFPGRGGDTPKSRDMLRSQIIDCVKERCGLLVHPHLFRHLAAKLYLEAHPGAYGVVRLLHGHKSVDTTTRFYCGMETAAAMRHYDDHILQLRGAPAPIAARRRRG